MPKRILLAIVSAVALLMPLASAEAQRRSEDWRPDNRADWDLLGTAQIGTRIERDTIDVGRREGRFSSIGFTVTGGDARVEELRIYYGGGGGSDVLRVGEVFKAGSRSRPIDLPGRATVIERIEIAYRAFGPVKIDFYGERRREARWDVLGCQRVGFLDTSDTIRVGRREGAFRAIKLQVKDATLRLNKVRVTFGDRSTQTFDVRAAIPKGTETRPFDLDGRRRVIERIDLEYIPSLALKKGPEVCVLATEGGGGFGGGPGPGSGRR
jgi:hypothetical protein